MVARIGPNDPCPCGSGRKVKRCCGDDVTRRSAGEELPADLAPTDSTVDVEGLGAHQLDELLVAEMLDFAVRRLGRGFDPVSWYADVLRSAPEDLQLFVPWAVYVHRVAGSTVAEHYVDAKGHRLSSRELAWLDAQRCGRLSFWEVTHVEVGESLAVRCMFTGEERVVTEHKGSRVLRRWDAVFGRVVDFEGASYFSGMRSLLLPPRDAAAATVGARGALDVLRLPIDDDLLRSGPGQMALFAAWEAGVSAREAAAGRMPVLQNTDGDPLLLTTERFALAPGARDEVASRLERLDGVDGCSEEDGTLRITLTKPGNRLHKSWENTIVAHLALSADELTVETNSTKRANRARRVVESACGALVVRRSRETKGADALLRAAPSSGPVEGTPPELCGELRSFKEQSYLDWLDKRVPTLRCTPRQAARRPSQRPRLEALLKEIEQREESLPEGERFDVGALRAELGL